MADSARFALHRPEFLAALERGEQKIVNLVEEQSTSLSAGSIIIQSNTQHDFVYRLVEGWACRSRTLPDGRNQFILIFLPGDLFAVKSMFMSRHVDSVRTLSAARIQRIHYRALHGMPSVTKCPRRRCNWLIIWVSLLFI